MQIFMDGMQQVEFVSLAFMSHALSRVGHQIKACPLHRVEEMNVSLAISPGHDFGTK